MPARHAPRGFTIIEILAVWMIIGIMVGLLLPAIQASREQARRMSCSNNMMQVGLGITAYHAAFEQLPMHMSGTDGSSVKNQDNDHRLSFLVALLPFLGHDTLAEDLRVPVAVDVYNSPMYGLDMSREPAGFEDEMMEAAMEASMEAAMEAAMEASMEPFAEIEVDESKPTKYWTVGGPEPFSGFPVWWFEVPEFRCPSDPGVGLPSWGRTNYAACLGDGLVAMDTGPLKDVNGTFQWDEQRAAQTSASMRGVFVPRFRTRFRDITDGLSATIMCGEIATNLSDHDRRTDALVGPGEVKLRDNPNWAYESGYLDTDRPNFWVPAAPVMSSVNQNIARGYRWADGAPLFTAFNTILPPNEAITLSTKREDASGLLPPSSQHAGCVTVCMADGSVRFVTDSIDAGDRSSPTPYVGSSNQPGNESVYGVWGAMGTRASQELTWPSLE